MKDDSPRNDDPSSVEASAEPASNPVFNPSQTQNWNHEPEAEKTLETLEDNIAATIEPGAAQKDKTLVLNFFEAPPTQSEVILPKLKEILPAT